MDTTISTALANEARRQELRLKVAALSGQQAANASLASSLSVQASDLEQRLASAKAQLATLEQGAGPGITDDFGEYSTLEQAMRVERFAGKAACIDYVKANPTCAEADALAAYKTAALAARPADRQWLLIDPSSLRQEYSASLVKLGLIPDTTWASWAAWIVATDKATILGLN